MIEALIYRVVNYIEKYDDRKQVSRPVMIFALQSLMGNLLTFLLCLLFGWATGKITEILLVFVCVFLLRTLTGGLHFASPVVCIVVSTLIIVSIPFIPINEPLGMVLTLVSALLVLVFAPADLKEKTLITEKGMLVRKIISLLIICSNLIFESALLALSFFCVALALIPIQGGKRHA